MTARTDVARRLTAQEAEEQGKVGRGEAWDAERQVALPLAQAVREDAIQRGEDLETGLARFTRNRTALLRFIAAQMVESEYTDKKYPAPGKMHDYYRLPGFDKKALTKQGSEKLAQFFNLRRAATESVQRECTKEFTLAVVRVTLVDKWAMPAGSGEAACSTAESGFQGERTAKKYGNDYRAAMNDVLARAGKRAYVQAVVYATATDELFDVTGEVQRAAEQGGVDEEQPTRSAPRFPAQIRNQAFADLAGKRVDEATDAQLAAILDYCKNYPRPATVQPIADAVTEELEHRRLEREGDAGL